MGEAAGTIRVRLLDGRPIARAALSSLVDRFEGVAVDHGVQGPASADGCRVVSVFVASGAGPDWVSRLRRVTREDPPVVVVVADGNPASVRSAFATGAEAVVDVGSDVAELEAAVRAAADGRYYADPTLAAAVIAGPWRSDGRGGGLTRRETDVLRLVADGRSNRAIGEHLGISVRTVEAHCLHLMRKLGVRGRRDLTQFAAAAGIDVSDDT